MSAEVFDSKGSCSILWGFVCPYSKFSVHKHRKLGTTKLHRNTRKVSRCHLQPTMSVVKCSCEFHLHYFQHQCHQQDIHCPPWIGIKKNDSTPKLQGILSKPIQPKLLMFVFLKLCAIAPDNKNIWTSSSTLLECSNLTLTRSIHWGKLSWKIWGSLTVLPCNGLFKSTLTLNWYLTKTVPILTRD